MRTFGLEGARGSIPGRDPDTGRGRERGAAPVRMLAMFHLADPRSESWNNNVVAE